MNLVVWGAGKNYIEYRHLIKHDKYRLVDSNQDKQGVVIDGIKVESPDIINKTQYDYIVISSCLYFDEIYDKLKYEFSISGEKIIPLFDMKLELIMRDIGRHNLQKSCRPRILFGFCFFIYANCRVHDYLLAESLRLRGAEIIPAVCGGIQELQCSVYGGVWGGDAADMLDNHKRDCNKCSRCSERVWGDWGDFNIVSAKDYITGDERKSAKEYIQNLDVDFIADWKYEYFPIGRWALRTYYNNQLISHKSGWNKEEESEIRNLAYNVIIMCIASAKMIEDVNPEIIYSNDSFYYPWSILELIARNKGIPFYNGYGDFRKDSYSYAMNVPVIEMYLESAWKTFSRQVLKVRETEFIKNYVSNRRYGRDMAINTADPFESARKVNKNSVYGEIRGEKKTALLAANITWDAAAIDKGILFENLIDWILYTVDLFSKHTEWQLIVKAHPGEVYKYFPEARERICLIVLERYNYQLPENIVLINADAPVSVYDLFGHINLGIVYTSTVGLEMCCNAIPTITVAKAPYSGKGFTYDPVTIEEYESRIITLMNFKMPDEKVKIMVRQAEKFFLLYYFVYMLPIPFYAFSYGKGVQLKMSGASELLPGKNKVWDYICDSILGKEPILSEHRFLPYGLKDD